MRSQVMTAECNTLSASRIEHNGPVRPFMHAACFDMDQAKKRGREVGSLFLTPPCGRTSKEIHAAPSAASLRGSRLYVLNRGVGQLPLFENPADYAEFERTLTEMLARASQ